MKKPTDLELAEARVNQLSQIVQTQKIRIEDLELIRRALAYILELTERLDDTETT